MEVKKTYQSQHGEYGWLKAGEQTYEYEEVVHYWKDKKEVGFCLRAEKFSIHFLKDGIHLIPLTPYHRVIFKDAPPCYSGPDNTVVIKIEEPECDYDEYGEDLKNEDEDR